MSETTNSFNLCRSLRSMSSIQRQKLSDALNNMSDDERKHLFELNYEPLIKKIMSEETNSKKQIPEKSKNIIRLILEIISVIGSFLLGNNI